MTRKRNTGLSIAGVLSWYEVIVKMKGFSPIALKEKRRVWGLFIEEYGAVDVADCRPALLLEFIANRGGKSNSTRRRIRATICTPFNAAARMGLIDRNPFNGILLPMGNHGRDWTDAEYQTILRNCLPSFRRFIVFMRFSGARPGELRAMRWDQIDEEGKCVVMKKHKSSRTTGKPRRIYLTRVAVKLLAWLRRQVADYVTDFVFLNSFGNAWSMQGVCKSFLRARRAAGLPEDLRLHGGRHFFATRAIVNGIDISTLAELLGHASCATTEGYLHMTNQRPHLEAAVEKAVGHAVDAVPAKRKVSRPRQRRASITIEAQAPAPSIVSAPPAEPEPEFYGLLPD